MKRETSVSETVNTDAQPLRLTYFNNEDPSTSEAGGGEVRMWEEATFLARQGHDVTLVCGRSDPNLPRSRVEDGVTIRTVKTVPDWLHRFSNAYFYLSRSLFAFFSVFYLLTGCVFRDSDIVVDNLTPHPSLAAPLASVLGVRSAAIVHEYHDRTALKKYNTLVGAIQLFAQNFLRIGVYDSVIVPNEITKRELESFGVRSPITVVPNGIHLEEYTLDSSHTSDLEYDFVTVSRLVHRKGVDRLLNAFAEVVAEQPEATLAIAGKGPKRDRYIERSEELGIRENVDFLGYVDESTKIGLLAHSTVFVLPSRQEGFGIVVLEAFAAGLPVVASDLPILQSWIPEAAARFEDADAPKPFGQAMSDLLQNQSSRERLAAEGQRVAKQFSWKRVANQALAVYQSSS